MRKNIFVIYFFLTITLFGNDYYYHQLSGGTLAPANNNETYVELVDEVIVFELFDGYYAVTVDFNFYNHGKEVELLVGFPYVVDTEGRTSFTTLGSIYDFQTWVNGSYVETKNSPIDIDLSDQKMLGVNYAYTKEVTFPSHEYIKTKVNYNAKYGVDGGYWLASYLYGSGKGWFNCIGKAKVIIKNSSKYWIYGIRLGMPSHNNKPLNNEYIKHYWNNNDLEFMLENIEPEYNDTIEILLWLPMFDFGPKPLPYFYYCNEIFKQNDLWYLTKEELRILRNLFYAIHGYNFKDASLTNYFLSNFGFYEINHEFTENMLTEIEKRNIDIIRSEELSRN